MPDAKGPLGTGGTGTAATIQTENAKKAMSDIAGFCPCFDYLYRPMFAAGWFPVLFSWPASIRSLYYTSFAMLRKLLLYSSLLLLTQCSKCKKDNPAPVDQLPPATQTGANTFGCLVNGQAYVPNSRYDDNVVLYEPGISLPIGGNLNIQTSHTQQAILFGIGPIYAARAYALTSPYVEGRASFYDRSKSYPCNEYGGAPSVYQRGQMIITRLDEQAHVLSGTFEFVLAQPGCDTIKVTQGRFDYKI